jgi:hypothetical protein
LKKQLSHRLFRCATAVTLAALAVAIPLTPGKSLAAQLVQLNNSIGDIIIVNVDLVSSDPNETHEGAVGEYALVNTSGGESLLNGFLLPSDGIWSDYYFRGVFYFRASQANETVSVGTPQSDGDDMVFLNAHPLVTQSQLVAVRTYALETMGLVGSAMLQLSGSPLFAELAVPGTTLVFLKYVLDKILEDPVDPNYTQIAVPELLSLPPLSNPQSGLSPTSVAALNALEANGERMLAVARALDTTLNRISGAMQAGNAYWTGQQETARDNFIGQFAALCASEITALTNVQNALTADGINLTISPDDVLIFETNLNFFIQGVPFPLASQLVTNLQTLGADAAAISDIIHGLIGMDMNAPAGAFPALLTNTALINALKDFSQSFGIPFGSFVADLKISSGSFSVGPKTFFSLGTGAPALDLSSQALTLQIGPDIINIPAGSFAPDGKSGNWNFGGPVGPAAVEAKVKLRNDGSYELQLQGSGVDTSSITANPVTVKLTLGSSFGSASVNADFAP